MNVCNAELFNFGDTYAVVVSGGGANAHGTEKLNKFICGHLLLNVGGQGGRYFHVAGEGGNVIKHLDESGYQRFLKEAEKDEIRRLRVEVPDPDAAMRKLEELLSKKWNFSLMEHNCASFAEEVVAAGGGNLFVPLECPYRLGTGWKPDDMYPATGPDNAYPAGP
jgi:hypothetical protein